MTEWRKGARRPCSVLWRYFTLVGHRREYFRHLFNADVGLDHVQCLDHQTYLRIDEYEELRAHFVNRVSADSSYWGTFFSAVHSKCRSHVSVCGQLGSATGLGDMPVRDLSALLETYVESNLTTIPVRYGYSVLDERLESLVKSYVEPEVQRLMGKPVQDVLCPRDVDFSMKELESILVLVASVQDIPTLLKVCREDAVSEVELGRALSSHTEVGNLVEQHLREFAWVNTVRYIGEPYDYSDVARMVRERINEDCRLELRQIVAERHRRQADMETLRRTCPDGDAVFLLQMMSDYAFLRNYRMDIFYIGDYYVRPVLNEIARRLGIEWESFVCLTMDEIVAWLKHGVFVPVEELRARSDYFDMDLTPDRVRVSTTRPKLATSPTKDRVGTSVRGEVANRGMAVGRACVVRTKRDLQKIAHGDVVISPMTTPDMNLPLGRCEAIVTDEGGILCHAAQYSREVGLPCVIGTGIASEVFWDGDMLKVIADSDEGLVLIIAA